MKNFPTIINAENFDDAKQFISKALVKKQKSSLVQKLVDPIASFLFLFLSLLLVYGAIFSLSDAEEMIVFKDLTFITNIWEKFSGLLTTPDMSWYVYWPILIVAAFLLPILVAAIIKIIVSIAYKPTAAINDEGTEAEKAKALHEAATKVEEKGKSSDFYFYGIPVIFIVSIVAFLIYSFFVVKVEFSIGMLIGLVVVGFIAFYVYLYIFIFFSTILSYFYGDKIYGTLAIVTDTYWLSVDPEEAARRKEEEERKAKEAAEARAKAAANRELGAQKRIQGLSAESIGHYSVAKSLFREAAYLGDALGMDNYARHCLIEGKRNDAIYWLQKSIDTGEADSQSRELLRALKNGEHINVHYN